MTSTETRETIRQYVERNRITATVTKDNGIVRQDPTSDRMWEHRSMRVQLRHGINGRRITTDWTQGMGVDTHPTSYPAGVLSSLILDASTYLDNADPMDLAASFGMDLETAKDRQRARTLWAGCRDSHEKLVKFLAGAGELQHVIYDVEQD